MSPESVADLIRALAKPAAFPSHVDNVEVHQTHISAVFLGGDAAYKIKKPVSLGFLDFSTLERRRHFCDEEVRLNRRLAPNVYLGVVPIAATADGLQFEAAGPVVEWAVKMVRMNPEMDLEHRIGRDEIDRPILRSLAHRIAEFHRQSPSSDAISRQARWDVVADNALANLAVASQQVGQTLSHAVLDRLTQRTRQTLDDLRPLIERRAMSGVPRDTHGDLRVDHVYWFPERAPPDDWCILDCIEFNEQFRFADPVADIAFLVMDLAFVGRWDLARAFADEYFQAAHDEPGRALLPLYASYRAAVRGKVDAILQNEREVPAADRAIAQQRAKAHWLAALGWLEPATMRPRVVLIGGLAGTGKSTLSKSLACRMGATILRADAVRKELAGVPATESRRSAFGEGIYSDAWNEQTYRELASRTESVLFNGGVAFIDASFREDQHRRDFLDLARRWGVPAVFLQCTATPSVAIARLRDRRGDVSDADESIYKTAAERWQPTSTAVARVTHVLPPDHPVDDLTLLALQAFEE